MRRLDRYLIREQLMSLLMGLAFFVAIFIVVDIFEKLDSFLDNKVPIQVVIHFYLVSIPSIVTIVLPMSMLLSCLLALGQIGRHNELTAMQAAGIGLARIVLPLYVFALLVCVAVFVSNETVMPRLNAARDRIYRGDIKRENLEGASLRTNLAYLGSDGRTFLIRSYSVPEKTMREVVIQEIRQHTLNGRIDAESAVWLKDHWVFREGFVRRFDREGEHAAHFTELVLEISSEQPIPVALGKIFERFAHRCCDLLQRTVFREHQRKFLAKHQRTGRYGGQNDVALLYQSMQSRKVQILLSLNAL